MMTSLGRAASDVCDPYEHDVTTEEIPSFFFVAGRVKVSTLGAGNV